MEDDCLLLPVPAAWGGFNSESGTRLGQDRDWEDRQGERRELLATLAAAPRVISVKMSGYVLLLLLLGGGS